MRNFRAILALAIFTFLISCNGSENDSPKKIFRFNQSSGITSLDPAFAKDLANMNPVGMIFNGLVRLDEKNIIVPDIAESWEISDDGLTYTFSLRDDVFFHDHEIFLNGKGRNVNVDDFIFSLSRIINPEVASPGAWIFSNSVDSLQPFSALNDFTLQIKLRKPFPPMLGILTMQYCSVVPHEAIEKYGKTFGRNPVGTGAFKFKSWEDGVAIFLVKNENYFENDAENILPYIDGVKISFINNKQSEFLEFENGGLDIVLNIDPDVMPTVLTTEGELQEKYKGKFEMVKSPFLNTEYLGFLMEPELMKGNPLQNKLVRQAINYGFDREEMIRFLRYGIGIPAYGGMIPSDLLVWSGNSIPQHRFDPKLAAQLLVDAGYPDGKGLPTLKLYTNSTYANIGSYIAKQLNDLGFQIEVQIEQPAFLREMMSKSQTSFFRGSWTADYPDPENYLACFYSKNGAPPNYTRFKNDQFDQYYEQALLENDLEKRKLLYEAMDRIIFEEAPVVPLYYDEAVRFIQNRVKNLPPNSQNLLDLRRVKFEN